MSRDIASDDSLPELARDLFAFHRREYELLQVEIEKVEAKLMEWHRNDECSQRLARIPGVDPIGASLLMMKTPDPGLFKSGRDFAAWIGLTPRDHSTAGRARPGGITRAGDEHLRSVLVVGATAVLKNIRAGRGKNSSPWLLKLLELNKKPKLVAVAMANRIARIAWKLMVSGESYRAITAQPVLTKAA